MTPPETRRYCGREFSKPELESIRQLIEQSAQASRAQLSRLVCQQLSWLKPDGGLKEMSCRVAMLRMQADEWIQLPPPRNANGNGRAYRRRTSATDPGLPIDQSVNQLEDLRLESVIEKKTSHLWNEYIQRYHYLGYQPMRGRSGVTWPSAGGRSWPC